MEEEISFIERYMPGFVIGLGLIGIPVGIYSYYSNIETKVDNSRSINTSKENSKGEMITKFTQHLSIDGREVSLGSLSGGEYRSFSLAVDFAIIDVLSKEYGMTLSPIMLDEPFDGLDSVGKEDCIHLLRKLAEERQIIVVDHSPEFQLLFDRQIIAEKRNGITSLNLEM